MDHVPIPVEECLDLPPCPHCGGRTRWVNTGLVELGRWGWHCATCSPPPTDVLTPTDGEGAPDV